MKKIFAFLLALFVLAALSGCMRRMVDFTMISTKNVDLSKAGTFQRAKSRVTGIDMIHVVLVPIGVPNMKEAIDKAIESVPGGVALVDGVITYKWIDVVIYGQRSYVVEGTPLIDPALAASIFDGEYVVTILDKMGHVKESTLLTKDQYNVLRSNLILDEPL